MIRYLRAQDGSIKVLEGQEQLATIKQGADGLWQVHDRQGKPVGEPGPDLEKVKASYHYQL